LNYISKNIPLSLSESEYKKIYHFIDIAQSCNANVFIEYEASSPIEFIRMKIYPSNTCSLIRDKSMEPKHDKQKNDNILYNLIREPYNPNEFQRVVTEIKKSISVQIYDYMQPVKYNWVERWPT